VYSFVGGFFSFFSIKRKKSPYDPKKRKMTTKGDTPFGIPYFGCKNRK